MFLKGLLASTASWHIIIGSCDRSAECHSSDIFVFQQIILDTYGALFFETLPKDFRNLGQVFRQRSYCTPVLEY